MASPGIEEYNGKKVRAQLVIPPEGEANIFLEGEMPCKMLYAYQVRPLSSVNEHYTPTLFGHEKGNCFVIIESLNFECGVGFKPAISQLEYGVYDPDERLRGRLL